MGTNALGVKNKTMNKVKNMAYWKHIPDKTSLKDIVWTDKSEYYYL